MFNDDHWLWDRYDISIEYPTVEDVEDLINKLNNNNEYEKILSVAKLTVGIPQFDIGFNRFMA